jgi:transposase
MKKEKTIHELSQEFPDKTYRELEKYREEDRQQEAGACIMGEMRKDREFEKEIDYHRYWKDMYEKEHKRRQEAEGETTIVKGIGQNSPEMKTLKSEVEALKQQLHTDREKYRRENNDLYNRIANSLEVNESHQKTNGKLQERLTEVEEENKKMHDAFDKQIDGARKAGL